VRGQQSVQPESIPASLKAAHHINCAAQLGRSLRPQIPERFEQRRCVAPLQAMQSRLLDARYACGHEPRREAEFDGDINGFL
jgi:hypothetical protein